MLDDPLYKQVYEICKAWSFDEIDANVARLGNVPIERRYVEGETEVPSKALIKAKTPEVFTSQMVRISSKVANTVRLIMYSSVRMATGLYGAHDMGLIQLKHQDYPNLDLSRLRSMAKNRRRISMR